MKKILVTILGTLIFVGLAMYSVPDRSPVKVESEQVMPEFEIRNVVLTFYMFDTVSDLREEVGYDKVLGLSDCLWNEDAGISYCDVWAVRPKFIDDEEACTIGHEVMHAIYGLYHTAEYAYTPGSGCN